MIMGRKAEIKDKFVYVEKRTGKEYEIGEYASLHISSLISNHLSSVGMEPLPIDDYAKKIHDVLEANSPVKLKKKSVLAFENNKLTYKQLKLLKDFFNKYIAVEPLSERDMKDWLAGEKFEIRVRNISYLSYLLSQLKLYDYICQGYEKVAVFNGTFLGSDGHELSVGTIKSSASKMAKNLRNADIVKRELLCYKKDIETLFEALKALKSR